MGIAVVLQVEQKMVREEICDIERNNGGQTGVKRERKEMMMMVMINISMLRRQPKCGKIPLICMIISLISPGPVLFIFHCFAVGKAPLLLQNSEIN